MSWNVGVIGFTTLAAALCLFSNECSGQDLASLLSPDLADGFDFPVGGADGIGGYTDQTNGRKYRGWRIDSMQIDALNLESRQTWNGCGGGNTDASQPVHALALGRVSEVLPDQLWLEHHYLDNGQPQIVRVGYAGVHECSLKVGDVVRRRQHIAKIAPAGDRGLTQLTITLQHVVYAEGTTWPMSVSDFIRKHRRLLVPAKEDRILVAIKTAYQLHVCDKGQVMLTVPMALGQDGLKRKREDGDNRTPVGEYRITQKAIGPFDGIHGAYLGVAWLRLSYPNAFDARDALRPGRITPKEHDAIVSASVRGGLPPASTSLGGGIGIHGWVEDWPDGQHNLTWGCLSLRKSDLLRIHDLVKKGTRVLILP